MTATRVQLPVFLALVAFAALVSIHADAPIAFSAPLVVGLVLIGRRAGVGALLRLRDPQAGTGAPALAVHTGASGAAPSGTAVVTPTASPDATVALLEDSEWLPETDPAELLPTNARARLVLALVSLGSLLLGTIGLAAGSSGLRAVCLLVFCLVGVGSAPWQGNVDLRLAARLTLTFFTGFAVLTFVSMAMLGSRNWHPLLAFTAVALACIPFHVLGLRSALPDVRLLRAARWPAVRVRPATLAVLAAGTALCLISAVAHRHLDPGFYGFLTQIGPAWYVGLELIVIALVTARRDEEQEMALPVLVLALVLTLTPALVYDGPRSQSAGKHVDLVMQIQSNHALVSSLDIYNNWSGFFASLAWLCDIAGIRDPMSLATFWPAVIAGFRVAALRFLFGQLLPARKAWVAVALAVLADSIGADYFSPQSIGFLIGLAVLGLALSSYRPTVRLPLLLIGGCVLAMSHQLSPYVVGGVLVVLVAFRQVRPWWVPLLVLGPAVLWALAHANALKGFLSLSEFGRTANFHPPPTTGAANLTRLPVVRETVVALLFSIAVLGVLALIGLIKNRHSRRYWAWALCPAAGVVLTAANAYGQEGVFRAALFGLPWLAVLAASWISEPARFVPRMGALVVVVALAAANLIAISGLDALNVIRPGDVAAYRYFQRQDGPRPAVMHYLLPLGSGDLPRGLPNLSGGHDPSLGRTTIGMPVERQAGVAPELEMRRMTAKLLHYSGEPLRQAKLYALSSPVQTQHDWAYAVRSPQRSAALRRAFSRSTWWRVVFHEDGSVLYRFDPARYAAAR